MASVRATGFLLSSTRSFGRRNCSNCHRQGSEIWCRNCAVEDVGQLRVFYCNEICRDLHAETHQAACQARRALSRAVSFCSEIWAIVNESTFSNEISSAYEFQHCVVLRFGNNETSDGPWTGESILKAFPDNILASYRRNINKKAILQGLDRDSVEIVTVAFPLIELVIGELPYDISEVSVSVKDAAILLAQEAGESDPVVLVQLTGHWVLLVTLPNGEKFGVDLTGPKFGWGEQIYTWDTFVAHRVSRIETVAPFGDQHEKEARLNLVTPQPTCAEVSKYMRRKVIDNVCRDLKSNFDQRHTTPVSFLTLSEADFVPRRNSLINILRWSIHAAIQNLRDKGIGRLHFDGDFHPQVINTFAAGQQFENIWLSRAEYDANKDDPAALQRIWTRKRFEALRNVPSV